MNLGVIISYYEANAQWRITFRAYVTWPRGQPGRGAMWRSGAPQSPSRPTGGDAHYGSQICDAALRPTRPKDRVAERRAAAPHIPRRPIGRRCTYLLLWAVALLMRNHGLIMLSKLLIYEFTIGSYLNRDSASATYIINAVYC